VRKAVFPKGIFTSVAGFAEPGESMEDALRREVEEETGIKIGKVSYVATQFWPFPSQLMIGCIAEALTEKITLDKQELEDGKCVTVGAVAKGLEIGKDLEQWIKRTEFRLPPPFTIAHQIHKYWVDQLQQHKTTTITNSN